MKDEWQLLLAACLIAFIVAVGVGVGGSSRSGLSGGLYYSVLSIIAAIVSASAAGITAWAVRRQVKIAYRQQETAERQAKIAHTQLVIAHRPKVVIRHVHMMMFVNEIPVAVRYSIVKLGDTEAQLVEWSVNCSILPKGLPFDDRMPYPPAIPPRAPITLQGSELTPQDFSWKMRNLGDFDLITQGKNIFYFHGVIAYRDGMGSLKRTSDSHFAFGVISGVPVRL